jgi:glyoxylase-like metal-dependent hydrolase (beta-lactamase superfamily II)
VLHHEDDGAEIHRVVVGPLSTNVHVLRCRTTGEAVLLDAAADAPRLVRMCRELGVGRVLQTHGHHDHIAAVPGVRAAGLPVGIAPADASMLRDGDADFALADGEVLEVGDLRLRTLFTPGHTPGSTCFVLEDHGVLFAGDTIFPGGPGATRPPYGDFPTIIRSISERLFSLDVDTIVMPGHGADTTIGAERPHLDEWIERGW